MRNYNLTDLKTIYSAGFQEGTSDKNRGILDNIAMRQAVEQNEDREVLARVRGYFDANVEESEQFGGPLGKFSYLAEEFTDERARIVRIHRNGERRFVAVIHCEPIADTTGEFEFFGYGRYTITAADEENLISPFSYTIIADDLVEAIGKLSEKSPEFTETVVAVRQ